MYFGTRQYTEGPKEREFAEGSKESCIYKGTRSYAQKRCSSNFDKFSLHRMNTKEIMIIAM